MLSMDSPARLILIFLQKDLTNVKFVVILQHKESKVRNASYLYQVEHAFFTFFVFFYSLSIAYTLCCFSKSEQNLIAKNLFLFLVFLRKQVVSFRFSCNQDLLCICFEVLEFLMQDFFTKSIVVVVFVDQNCSFI